MKLKKTIHCALTSMLILSNFYFPIKVDASNSFLTYKVKKGDTLYAIAKKFHTTTTQIQKDNHLKSLSIKTNQTLSIRNQVITSTVKAPSINTLSAITSLNAKTYAISGSGEANAAISLTLKDSKNKSLTYTVKADSKGKFYTKVNISSLNTGSVTLTAFQKNTKGVKSGNTVKSITKDTLAPSITLQISNITSTNQSSYLINGTTEANLKVMLLVSDGKHAAMSASVTSDSKGKFSKSFDVRSLNNGTISIRATVSDKYSNSGVKTVSITKTVTNTPALKIYNVNATQRTKFGIYNDGTHPVETTKGINDAIIYASKNGYNVVEIPGGKYLIDKDKSVNLVSNITLQLDKTAVFQKETNGYKGYSVVTFGTGVQNATVEGGTLIGDRDTHDFSSGGTQEWGYGVLFSGGDNNTAKNMNIQKMTGDGVYVGFSPVSKAWEAKNGGKPNSTIEQGGIDDQGNPTNEAGKIRSIGMIDFGGETNDKYRMINIWNPQGLTSYVYSVYYYKQDGTFLSKDTAVANNTYSKAPKEAYYYRLVFSAPSVTGVYVLMYPIDIATNVHIENNDIGFNRRQGITSNGDNVQIINNHIHDTKGTAPQAGIDIEPITEISKNQLIKGNTFENNVIQMVVSKGDGLNIDSNKFIINKNVGGAGVGLYIWDSFKNVQISNNYFEGRGLTTLSAGTTLTGNSFKNATSTLKGSNQTFTKGTFDGSTLYVESSASVTDTTFNAGSSFMVDGEAHVKNVNLTGTTANPVTLGGSGVKESTYEYLTVVNGTSGSTTVPSGTYTNSSFTYTGQGTSGLGIQYAANFAMDHVTFKNITFTMHSINHGAQATFKNSTFTYDGELKQSAISAGDGESITLLNNKFYAKNTVTSSHPIVSFGRELDMFMAKGLIDGNEFHIKSNVNAVDTTGAYGTGIPGYTIQNNIIYNGTLKLHTQDININNKFFKE